MGMKWRTKDGRVLDVEEMETDHLKSCIKLMRSAGFMSMSEFWAYLKVPWGNMGECAEMAVEQEMRAAKPTFAIDKMEEELERRGHD